VAIPNAFAIRSPSIGFTYGVSLFHQNITPKITKHVYSIEMVWRVFSVKGSRDSATDCSQTTKTRHKWYVATESRLLDEADALIMTLVDCFLALNTRNELLLLHDSNINRCCCTSSKHKKFVSFSFIRNVLTFVVSILYLFAVICVYVRSDHDRRTVNSHAVGNGCTTGLTLF
jgi:hypothetical protein